MDNEILEILKDLQQGQKEMTGRLGILEEGQKEMTGRLVKLEEGQKDMQKDITEIKEDVKALKSDIIPNLEGIYGTHNIKLYERVDNIDKSVRFIKHKLHETEEEVFDIKDKLKIAK